MIDKNDPRLTAYAVGELEAAEAAAFEVVLAAEPEARAEVSDIRQTANDLRLALTDESAPALTDGQREAIRASAVQSTGTRLPARLRLLAWTLTAAAACVVVALALRPHPGRVKGPLSLAPQATPAAAPSASIEAKDADTSGADREANTLERSPRRAILREAGERAAAAAAEPMAAGQSGDAVGGGQMMGFPAPGMAAANGPAAEVVGAEPENLLAMHPGGEAPAGVVPIPALKAKALDDPAAANALDQVLDLGLGGTADEPLPDSPFRSASEEPLSTLPMAVDTTTYKDVRTFLIQGQMPPQSAVRIEGLVNHFRYEDGTASVGLPFSLRAEVAACPWKPEQRLVRIAVQRSRQADRSRTVATLEGRALDEATPAAVPLGDRPETPGEVRLEVEFSPANVAVYRLIGSAGGSTSMRLQETVALATAYPPGASVNAFYQVIPAAPEELPEIAAATPIVATAKTRLQRTAGRDQARGLPANLLTVTLRWPPVGAGDNGILELPVPDRPQAWEETSHDMQFGSAVALFGMLLRQSPHAAGATFDTVLALAGPAAGRDAEGERAEFLELVRKAKRTQAVPQR